MTGHRPDFRTATSLSRKFCSRPNCEKLKEVWQCGMASPCQLLSISVEIIRYFGRMQMTSTSCLCPRDQNTLARGDVMMSFKK